MTVTRRRRLPPTPSGQQLHARTMRWDPHVYALVTAYAAARNITISYAVHLLVTEALAAKQEGCHVVEGSVKSAGVQH